VPLGRRRGPAQADSDAMQAERSVCRHPSVHPLRYSTLPFFCTLYPAAQTFVASRTYACTPNLRRVISGTAYYRGVKAATAFSQRLYTALRSGMNFGFPDRLT